MKTDLTVTMLSSRLPGGRMEMSATGALDNQNHRMSMRLDMSKLASHLGAAGGDGARGRLGRPGGRRLLERPGSDLPEPAGARKVMPGGKPWIKVDLSAVGKQAGIDLSQFTQLGTDPAQMVGWLRTVSGDVTTVGTEQIDGVDTTHYRATSISRNTRPRAGRPARGGAQGDRPADEDRAHQLGARCTSGSTRAAWCGRSAPF
jgi:hypothetical protein